MNAAGSGSSSPTSQVRDVDYPTLVVRDGLPADKIYAGLTMFGLVVQKTAQTP
jgi:hypothetical protein